MQRPTASVLLAIFAVLAACSVPTVSLTGEQSEPVAMAGDAAQGDAAGQSPQGESPAKSKAKPSQADAKKAREKKQRELRKKLRELERLPLKTQIAELERRVKLAGAEASRDRAKADLELAKAALEHFVTKSRPREIEEHRIRIDRSMHRADHAKDEFGELTAMYEADEFAKATKELVLKRGRRSQEMADRDLAVAKQKFEAFEQFDLPKRERELKRKVEDAGRAVQKTAIEFDRVRMQHQLSELEAKDKRADLEVEIADLRAELKAKP